MLSTLLLIVLVISIFPWKALELCPNKDGHHSRNGAHHGNCTNGMMNGNNSDESSESKEEMHSGYTLKAVPCTGVAPAVDSYDGTQTLTTPSLQKFAVLAILFDWAINSSSSQQQYYPVPEFPNKSGPPPAVNPLRGPPAV